VSGSGRVPGPKLLFVRHGLMEEGASLFVVCGLISGTAPPKTPILFLIIHFFTASLL